MSKMDMRDKRALMRRVLQKTKSGDLVWMYSDPCTYNAVLTEKIWSPSQKGDYGVFARMVFTPNKGDLFSLWAQGPLGIKGLLWSVELAEDEREEIVLLLEDAIDNFVEQVTPHVLMKLPMCDSLQSLGAIGEKGGGHSFPAQDTREGETPSVS
jgi:hypothetical protein